MRQVDTIIFDFDNTLWDQFAAYEQSMGVLLDEIGALTGDDRAKVLHGVVEVQTRYKIRENAALIEQHPSLVAKFGNPVPADIVKPLSDAFAEAEQSRLTLFDNTRETLTKLKNQGFKLVMFTESNADRVARRVKALGLDHYFERIYSAPPGDMFADLYASKKKPVIRTARYGLAAPQKYVTSVGPKKSGDCLQLIIADIGRVPGQVLMVGDNLARDVRMAQTIGAFGAYAEYGVAKKTPGNLYDQTGYGAFAPKNPHADKVLCQPDIALRSGIAALPAELAARGARPTPAKVKP